MSTDLITKSLSGIAPLPDELLKRLHDLLVEETLPKKSHLLFDGQIAKKIYFINSGFARAYYFTDKGRECTSWFVGKGDFLISVFSFFTQKPAMENIELLEDSELLSITWSQLMSLYSDYCEFNYYGRLITEKYFIQAEERNILLRTLTARERYNQLLKLHPKILQHASLGQMASYLGITQETLSRVRGLK